MIASFCVIWVFTNHDLAWFEFCAYKECRALKNLWEFWEFWEWSVLNIFSFRSHLRAILDSILWVLLLNTVQNLVHNILIRWNNCSRSKCPSNRLSCRILYRLSSISAVSISSIFDSRFMILSFYSIFVVILKFKADFKPKLCVWWSRTTPWSLCAK